MYDFMNGGDKFRSVPLGRHYFARKVNELAYHSSGCIDGINIVWSRIITIEMNPATEQSSYLNFSYSIEKRPCSLSIYFVLNRARIQSRKNGAAITDENESAKRYITFNGTINRTTLMFLLKKCAFQKLRQKSKFSFYLYSNCHLISVLSAQIWQITLDDRLL